MSLGGVFTLISNQGLQDQLLMQTDALRAAITQMECDKMASLRKKFPNMTDDQIRVADNSWLPTLAAIDRSHSIFISASYKPFATIAHEYSKTIPSIGSPSLGGTFSFVLPLIGDFVNDAVMHITLTGLSAKSNLDKVRYVEMLGHRLTKLVRLKVQNQEIDSYTTDTQNANFQFKVPLHKETGYLRNIGQELPKQGYLTADPTVDEVREYRWFGDGPQTFKYQQQDVEMWIPIWFWFKDVQCSLPNFILPKNQTEIEITLETENNLVAFADYGGGGQYNVPTIKNCELYLNHLFMLPEITNLFIRRFGMQLIRVHRVHNETLTASATNVRLQQLKWPLENLFIGFRPKANLLNSQKWYKNTHITNVAVKEAVVTGVASILVNNAIYFNELHPVSSLGLRANDVIIYPSVQPEFYNNYIPLRYGCNYKTPKDLGWYMMNFNFNPGEYQPSGHFNCSRARELYLEYVSNVDASNNNIISSSTPVDLMVIADAINFIWYQNNTMTLRFAT